MRLLFLLFIVIILLPISSFAADFKWTYEDGYRDRLLFIHPYVNYHFNSDWYNRWEANYFSGQGFLFNVGSVTTHDLLVDGSLVINQSLGKGFRFRGEARWLETLHLRNSQKSVFMGLEKKVLDCSSVYLIVNPAYDKEFTDLNMGFLFADSSYQNYFRIGLLWEDFVYEEKNGLDGISHRIPLSIQWYTRYHWKNLVLYTDGRLSQGFERDYPNVELTPELRSHNLLWNDMQAKLYYLPSDESIFGLSGDLYYFKEKKTFTIQENNYDYLNKIYHISFDYLRKFKQLNRFRIQLQYVIQKAQSEGYHAHRYDRQDFLSAISYERFISAHTLEFQYMYALPRWTYVGIAGNPQNYDESGMMDKLKFAWTYNFPQGAKFSISISHEVRSGNFGGANCFYMMLF